MRAPAEAKRGPMRRMGGRMMGGGMHSMLRHQHVMREGQTAVYERLGNPMPAAGAALSPQLSNIARLPRMPLFSSDAYL